MRIGIFADSHDHVDHVRWVVNEFNRRGCDYVLFAGDMVSTFVTPALRRLRCPFLGCFGDNDGNWRGLLNGTRLIGQLGPPPFGWQTPDGVKILLTHMLRDLRGQARHADVVVYAHTHKPLIRRDAKGRLLINPGELSGWTYRQPTAAVLETQPLSASIICLPAMPPKVRLDNE